MSFKVVRGLCKPKVHFKEPSLTRQEFTASSDMNFIVSKFLRTGQIDMPNAGRPMVDGLEFPNDFTEACNLAFERRHEEVLKHNEEQKHEQKQEQKQEQKIDKSDLGAGDHKGDDTPLQGASSDQGKN